jgi:hypothetical protein
MVNLQTAANRSDRRLIKADGKSQDWFRRMAAGTSTQGYVFL